MVVDDTILDAGAIEKLLSRMISDIVRDQQMLENLALIGIQTRGVYLAKRIQARIYQVKGADIPTGDMDIALYRDDWTLNGHQPKIKTTHILFPIDGKRVILVDDVLFTGRTARAAMDAIIDFGRPDRIELAVLVDRGHRELPIQADYIGKVIPTQLTETVDVRLSEVDGEDKVTITKNE
jgi:pyrimidine operon attenuation protein/uracil phosphoribosyltransferase